MKGQKSNAEAIQYHDRCKTASSTLAPFPSTVCMRHLACTDGDCRPRHCMHVGTPAAPCLSNPNRRSGAPGLEGLLEGGALGQAIKVHDHIEIPLSVEQLHRHTTHRIISP